MKAAVIVGARPQFIKACALSVELRKRHEEIIIHTGQHYDVNMSDNFFKELEIPAPKYFLEIGSHNQGVQTGLMLGAIEEVLIKENPDYVVVLGDTNSTIAGALAAVKLHIPIAHVEAGLRSYNRLMPEEINRVIVDHISDLLFTPGENANNNLTKEGILKNVFSVGDIMYDLILKSSEIALKKSKILKSLGLTPSMYYLATIHRAENTDNPDNLRSIFDTFSELEYQVVLPLHPRTKNRLEFFNIMPGNNIKVINPVGYLDMINLMKNSIGVFTDSGGIQKEAYYLKVPVITLRNETEWTETVEAGWNFVTGLNRGNILDIAKQFGNIKKLPHPQLYGNGDSAIQIVSILESVLNKN